MAFRDYPIKRDKAHYDRAREWAVYINRDYGVYEYGGIDFYGLSDIDLIVIGDYIDVDVPDEFRHQFEGRKWAVMRPEHFKKIKLLGDINLRRLSGQDIVVDKAPNPKMLCIAQIMDWLPERILRLKKFYGEDIVSVMDVLGYMKSFFYSVEECHKLLNTRLGLGVIHSFYYLRKGWFERDIDRSTSLLLNLLGEAIWVGNKLMELVSDYLVKNHYYIDWHGDWEFHVNKDMVYRDVPDIWAVHLAWLSDMGGIIGNLINNNLSGDILWMPPPSLDYICLLSERMALCNSMAEFTNKGLYRFGHLEAV